MIMKPLLKTAVILSTIGINLSYAGSIIEPMDNTIQPMNNIIQPMNTLIYPILGDVDGDGIENSSDPFPGNPTEWLDTDNDGIGNNADKDDDNDGMLDSDEIHYGFKPLDASDAILDADGDGINNLKEIQNGTNPLGDITMSSIFKEIAYGRWEEISYIDDGDMIIGRERNQTITCSKIYNHRVTEIISEVEGVQVKWYIDGKVDFIFPFADTIKFRLENSGKVVLYMSNATVPNSALPAGTTILINTQKTEIVVPLSKSDRIRFKED